MSDFLFVSLSDALDKCVDRVVLYDADRASAETAACDTGTDHTRDLPCKIHKDIDLFTGNFIVVAQGNMRLVHQFPELCDISFFQGSYRVDRPLVLVYGMFRAFQLYRILDQSFVCLKFIRCQIAQCFDVQFCLECGQRIRTLLAPVIVSGIYKAVFHLAVCDNDLCIVKDDGSILIFHCICVKEDGIVFLSHCNGKLIHDTAVAAVEVILRILTDEGEVSHGQCVDAVKIRQNHSCQHFQ